MQRGILFSPRPRQVSTSSAAGGGAGTEGPTFRVKPVALLLNLCTHWGWDQGQAWSGTERETKPVPSWPGLLPLSDPEAGSQQGGRGQGQLQKPKEGNSPLYLTRSAYRKRALRLAVKLPGAGRPPPQLPWHGQRPVQVLCEAAVPLMSPRLRHRGAGDNVMAGTY